MAELHLCSTCNRPCGRAGTDPRVRKLYKDTPTTCPSWTDNYKEPVCPKCGGKLVRYTSTCYYEEHCENRSKGCDYSYEWDSSD